MIVTYSMPEGEGLGPQQPEQLHDAEQQQSQESVRPDREGKASAARTRGEAPKTGDRADQLHEQERLEDLREGLSGTDVPEITPGPERPAETEEEQKIREAFENNDGEKLYKALNPDGPLEADPEKLAAATRIAEQMNSEKVHEQELIDNFTKMGLSRDKMRQLISTQFKNLVDGEQVEQLIKAAEVIEEDDAVKPSPEMQELEEMLDGEDFEKLQAIIAEAPQNPEEAAEQQKEADEYIKNLYEKYGPKVLKAIFQIAVAAGIAFLLSYLWMQTKLGSAGGGGGRGGGH
jgi:hypothetical protein